MTEKIWQALELIRVTAQFLAQKTITPARLDAEILLAEVLHCSRLDLYARHETVITPAQLATYRELIRRRVDHEPVSRLLGKKDFMGLTFRVTPEVLSPRPETEILVEQVLKILSPERKAKKSDAVFQALDNKLREFVIKQTNVERGEIIPQEMLAELDAVQIKNIEPIKKSLAPVDILELGTGSGCIAIALAKNYPPAKIIATDLSETALNVARENAEKNGVNNITFRQGDWFDAILPHEKFAFIIANPPYISPIAELPPEVKNYDPAISLFAANDGLSNYEKIVARAGDFLLPNGYVVFEVGAEQAETVKKIITQQFSTAVISTVADYAGIDRVVCAHLPS